MATEVGWPPPAAPVLLMGPGVPPVVELHLGALRHRLGCPSKTLAGRPGRAPL